MPHYRPDIDGLRAVAVLSVLAFHAFPLSLGGGFVGVDIFFVISGYLISGIIFRNLAGDRFSFLEFYQRRIRRIFPALVVVLAATLVAGWFLLLPDDYRQLGKHVAGGAAFVSNLVLWSESGYFDTAAALKPLLHLWSLGIEEQFYLVWPLVLWIAWRKQFNTTLVIGVIFAISLVSCLWLTSADPTAAFYSPITRFWELLVGALLAAIQNPTIAGQRWRRVQEILSAALARPRVADAASLLGAVLIGLSLVWLDESQPFPGWRATLPTLGACLLIAAGPDALTNRWILSRRFMVWTGLISYPLYLWHWPLLAFQNLSATEPTPVAMRIAALALAFLLAAGTYHFIESPLRFGPRATRAPLRLGAGMTAVAFAGLVVLGASGFNSRVPGAMERYANFQYDFQKDARVETCWLIEKQAPDAFADSCIDDDQSKPLMVIWGDSHAARFFPGLRSVAGGKFRLAQFTRNACLPVGAKPGLAAPGYANCSLGNAYVMSRIAELRPDTVVLFAYWESQWTPGLVDSFLLPTIRQLHDSGVAHVIVMGPAPHWRKALPANLIDLNKETGSPPPRRTAFGLTPGPGEIDASLRAAIGEAPGVRYFSVLSALCDTDGCLTRIGNDPDSLVSWDYGHLTTPGATYVANALARASHGFQE